jgi:hypothetical protein
VWNEGDVILLYGAENPTCEGKLNRKYEMVIMHSAILLSKRITVLYINSLEVMKILN